MSDDWDAAFWGRVGAFTLHSRYSGRETTAAARAAWMEKWERQVDPLFLLPVAERAARASAARRAYLLRLSWKSAQVRRERAAARRGDQAGR